MGKEVGEYEVDIGKILDDLDSGYRKLSSTQQEMLDDYIILHYKAEDYLREIKRLPWYKTVFKDKRKMYDDYLEGLLDVTELSRADFAALDLIKFRLGGMDVNTSMYVLVRYYVEKILSSELDKEDDLNVISKVLGGYIREEEYVG